MASVRHSGQIGLLWTTVLPFLWCCSVHLDLCTTNPHPAEKCVERYTADLNCYISLLAYTAFKLFDVAQLIVNICKQKHSRTKYTMLLLTLTWIQNNKSSSIMGKQLSGIMDFKYYIPPWHCIWMGSLIYYNWFWIILNGWLEVQHVFWTLINKAKLWLYGILLSLE